MSENTCIDWPASAAWGSGRRQECRRGTHECVRHETLGGLPVLLALAACLLATFGCSKKEEKEAEAVAPVQVAPVAQDTIHRIVEADAVLYPHDQYNAMPKIAAPVQKYLANRGDHVKANQLLAVLENRDLTAAAAANQAQVAQAEANLHSTTAATIPESIVKARTDVEADQEQFDAAKKVLDSREALLKEGATPRKTVDDARVAYVQAKSQLDTAKEHLRILEGVGQQEQVKTAQAQVDTAQAQYRSAQAQVAYSEIRTPIGGVVADRPVYAGDIAQPGSPLFTVMDVSRVVARANVPQAQAAFVKVGQPATIKLTEGAQEASGRVTVVSPATDAASTTVQVWVEADNPGERLKPGASVRVAIVTQTIKDATVVPPSAIVPGEEGGTAVMTVAAGDTAHLKKVEVGVRETDKVQILSGVSPGDQVISVGALGLEDKAKIRIVKPGEKDEEPAADEAGGKGEEKSKEK